MYSLREQDELDDLQEEYKLLEEQKNAIWKALEESEAALFDASVDLQEAKRQLKEKDYIIERLTDALNEAATIFFGSNLYIFSKLLLIFLLAYEFCR